MSIKQRLNRLREKLDDKLQPTTTDLLFRWIVNFRSQALVSTEKSAMVFSPHQDDETLGCGGMIALKRAQGVPVKVVFLTNGQYGRPKWIKPEEIVEVRKQEAIAALTTLGVTPSEVGFLEQKDGSLQHLPNEQRQRLIEQLAQLLQDFKPEEIYLPHRRDRHPDHEATYELVQAAVAKAKTQANVFQYGIWIFWQSPLSFNLKSKELANAYRLSIDSAQAKKQQAIETYQSQIPGLTRGFLTRFYLPHEIFFKV
jgi:LmbE family N-acetylglucosaminyl deacetylase